MRPTSDSSRFATTCIFVRSAARMKSVGACMLAATVWPTSTLREMTRPSIGASMTVCSQVDLVLVERRLRLRDLRLPTIGAAPRPTRTSTSAASRSLFGEQLPSPTAPWRASSFVLRVVERRPSGARGRPAARIRFARACSIWVWKSDGSSRARTWPFFTSELKSALSSWMVPDTCVPTWTVVTACSVPVAPTVSTTSPRVTARS